MTLKEVQKDCLLKEVTEKKIQHSFWEHYDLCVCLWDFQPQLSSVLNNLYKPK